MSDATTRPTDARQELVEVIRQVRRRWRTRILLQGGIIILAGALAAIAIASFGLQTYKFSPQSVTGFRIAVFAAFAGLLGFWLVRPLRRQVTDLQVALYVEEHEPKLQAAILAAVDIGGASASGQSDVPAVIIDKLVAQAIEKCKTIEGGRAIGRIGLRRAAMALGAIATVGAFLLVAGPEFLRQGASALLVLSKSAEAASPYAITVQPGDAKVPKGSDQAVHAKLAGFKSNDVGVWVKAEGQGQFSRVPLVATTDTDRFEGMLFDVKSSLSYYVEADGVKSPTYEMTVVELPAVSALEMEYIYPAYTGLAPQKVEVGGDVAALAGTEVRVKITSTMKTSGGKLQVEPAGATDLAVEADGVTLTGSFKILQDGYYHVELTGPNGEKVSASPKYTVDVIEDRSPSVSIDKPKRDIQANPIEEVFIQARAQDDFGVKQLDLIYSVNGGPEKSVSLYGKGAKVLDTVSAGHTVYLEELGVKPGDFVSYYAKATDTDTVKGPKTASSDIYFIQVRPFSQNFKQAQSQQGGGGGGGGGGGQQNQPGALSQQQRQIISATFNVDRDRAKSTPEKFKEDVVFVGLSQSKIRDEVDTLIQQMTQRIGATGGENIQHILEALPKAVTEMKAAEDLLKAQKPKEALGPEQRALKFLQDAEQAYELEVRQQQQGGGGGGGGGGGQMAQDLADLFQLQLDRMANQYETAQSAAQQSSSQQVDEIARRLQELAKRQLLAAEAQRRAGQQGNGSGSGQRALADQMDEIARQLEQMRRDAEKQGQQRQDLSDAARRLQDAANTARQAAANGNNDNGAQASRALQSIQEAQRLLQNNQTQQSAQDAKSLQQKADELAKQQRDVASKVSALDTAGAQRESRMQQLSQTKDEMLGKVTDIEQQLNRLSRESQSANQRDAARKLDEAAVVVRNEMIKEKIEYSKQAMAGGSDYSKAVESQITQNLDTLKQKIGDAVTATARAQQDQGLPRAVNDMRNVSTGLQSLNEQLNQQLGQQGQGQQGQGQQGQGQQGQGQQGQGQQGQGQQGQGQQGQGQQGQGQQGQGQQGQGQQGQGQQGQGQQGQGQQGQGQQGQGQQGQGQQGQGQQGQGQQGQGQQGQGQQGQGQGQGQGRQPGQQGQGGGQGQGQPQQGTQRLGGQSQNPNAQMAGGDARPGDARQLANQARQLANDASDVRRQLQQAGVPPKDLTPVDDVVKALQQLGNEKNLQNPAGLQELYQTAVQKFKALEFEIRKRADTTNEQLFLSGSEDVPPAFKDLIAEYYKALAKKGGGK